MSRISPDSLADLLHGPQAPVLLDVREPAEFLGPHGHIEGSSIFPVQALAAALEELRGFEDRTFVTVCDSGKRAEIAARILAGAGFPHVCTLDEGIEGWSRRGYPLKRY